MTRNPDSRARSGAWLRTTAALLFIALVSGVAAVAWRVQRSHSIDHEAKGPPPVGREPREAQAAVLTPPGLPERTDGGRVANAVGPAPSAQELAGASAWAVSGQVLDPYGSGVAGAVIRVAPNREGYATSFGDEDEVRKWEAVTDGDGRWTAASLPAGRWIFRAADPHWAPGYSSPIQVGPAVAPRPVVIQLHAGTELRGIVRRAGDDAPVEDAVVWFSWVMGDVNDSVEARTDRAGQFRLEHLTVDPSDTGILHVQAAGFVYWYRNVRTGAPVDLRLTPRRPIVIRLRDARGGQPDVYGVYLARYNIAGPTHGMVETPRRLLDEPAGTEPGGWVTLRIDEDLPGIPDVVPELEDVMAGRTQRFPAPQEVVEDRVCVLLRDGRHGASAPIWFPVGGGPVTLDVSIPNAPRIKGRVVSADGREVRYAWIACRPGEDFDLGLNWSALTLGEETGWRGVGTDRDGRFDLYVCGEGPYDLIVQAEGHPPYKHPHPVAQDLLPTGEIEIRLP